MAPNAVLLGEVCRLLVASVDSGVSSGGAPARAKAQRQAAARAATVPAAVAAAGAAARWQGPSHAASCRSPAPASASLETPFRLKT